LQVEAWLGALDAHQLFGPSASIYGRFPATWFKGEFLPSHFFLKLAYKDYRLAAELAAINKVPTKLIAMCEQETAEAMGRGWGDHERVITNVLQEERSGVQIRTAMFAPAD
jgi:3-hydroxyisobutyrate dehydrogenase-like beta-hydroxyacid dehydrogenase